MKTTYLAFLLAIARTITAHEVWHRLIVNGTVSEPWQYVRDVDREFGDEYSDYSGYNKMTPNFDMYDLTIRCGRNASKYGPTTDIATVVAGTEIGFSIRTYDDKGLTHPGPILAYMSRAPEGMDLREYEGEGEWWKVAELGAKDSKNWYSTWLNEWNFTIPRTTPPGDYLLRVEQVWPTMFPDYIQFFTNCAQVRIVGEGGGKPGPTVRFPGGYQVGGKGLVHTQQTNDDITKYEMPGPELWTG